MSGKRQHYIPRFIIDRFTHRVKGTERYCWVYLGRGKLIESNTKNVGVEGYFYGESVKGSLDEKITIIEESYSEVVKSIVSNDSVDQINADTCVDLVVHLSLRTQQLRNVVFEVTSSMISHTQELLSDKQILGDFAVNSFATDPKILETAIEEEIQNRGVRLTKQQKYQLIMAAKTFAPTFVKAEIDNLSSTMSENMSEVSKVLPSALKSGHNAALMREDLAVKRRKGLAHLKWLTHKYPDNTLILGDCPVWAISGEKNQPSSLAWAAPDVHLVVLPIAHNLALIGTNKSMSSCQFDADYLNSTSASLSKEFIVCSRKPDSSDCTWISSFATKTAEAMAESIEYSKSKVKDYINREE